jgi:hypothetical protein
MFYKTGFCYTNVMNAKGMLTCRKQKAQSWGIFRVREKTGCPFQGAVAYAPLVAARLDGKPPTLPGHHLPKPTSEMRWDSSYPMVTPRQISRTFRVTKSTAW